MTFPGSALRDLRLSAFLGPASGGLAVPSLMLTSLPLPPQPARLPRLSTDLRRSARTDSSESRLPYCTTVAREASELVLELTTHA